MLRVALAKEKKLFAAIFIKDKQKNIIYYYVNFVFLLLGKKVFFFILLKEIVLF